MFRFENPEMLYLLAVIPVLLLVYILYTRWRKRALEKYGDLEIVRQLSPGVSKGRSRLKIWLQLGGLFLLILAAANPQFGSRLDEVKTKGIDLMVALDISNSMLAEDFRPNRLARAKQLLTQIIEELDGDRFGLVVFAGEAFVQLPLTTDYPAILLFLNTLTTDVISTQGTAVGNAISLSMQSLENAGTEGSKVVLVISDGENHEDDAIATAREAAAKGILVFTAGIGSPEGVPIPEFSNGNRTGFKKDREGNTVVSKLNEDLLKQVADAGGGSYVRVSGTQMAQEYLLNEFTGLEEGEGISKKVSEYESYFQFLIALSLLCWTAEFFISRRIPQRYRRDRKKTEVKDAA